MLIPTSYQKLPNVESCHNGAVVMGGVVGQLASALAQLSNTKFLAEAHYQVSHSIYGRYGYGSSTGGISSVQPLSTYKSKKYYFLYQSSSFSSHLAINLQYSANTLDDTPNLKVKLLPSTGSSYYNTPIDYGIEFTNNNQIESDLTGAEIVRTLFTGCELIEAPTNTTPDPPRPLYIPSGNRGELLIIEVELTAVALASIHIYDIYKAEVTI